MLNTFLYPYKLGSGSIANLKAEAGFKVIKLENSKFKPTPDKLVVNWGASNMPNFDNCIVLNDPSAVKIASDKLKFFDTVKNDVTIPEYTTEKSVAEQWSKDGAIVVCRETLTGHSGQGIYVAEDFLQFSSYLHKAFKIYTKYVPKADEYRIHVFNGAVIDMQRKAMKKGHPVKPNFKVRTHRNGFVFVRENVDPHPLVLEEALKAVEVTGLDFGAVDVIWNNYREKAYVLEINTAPGLEGQTVSTYMKAIEEFAKEPVRTSIKPGWVKSSRPFKEFAVADVAYIDEVAAAPVDDEF